MPDKQHGKEPADPSIAALVALLKSKNMISAEEAASFSGQTATPGAEESQRIEKIKASPRKIEKKEATAAAPKWAERVRFGGDIRLRSESDRLSKDTASVGRSAEPVTSDPERSPSGSDAAASDQQRRKEPADQEIAALVALLRSKNVISAEEASRLTAQSPSTAGEKGTAVISEATEQERIEKIAAKAIELVMTNIQDQVKKQVREELAKEMKKHEKEQIEAITAGVTEEIKKSLPERVKSEARGELPGELSEKEQTQKITAIVTEELKKGFQEEVSSQVKEEVAREMKEVGLVANVMEWFKRIRIEGDVRLRYQGDFYDENNADFLKPSNPTEVLNSTVDRNRFLGRARLGVKARITDEVEAGVRIATGSLPNPVSENVVLGDYESYKAIALDRLYIRWKPVPNLTLWGGRMENPFFRPYSQLVWDDDLSLDGFALNYTLGVKDRYSLFATALASPLQEFEVSTHDKWLFGGQLGFQHNLLADLSYTIAAAYYGYRNITGEANNPLRPGEKDFTVPAFLQKGNTLFDIDPSSALKLALASEYKLINLTGEIDITIWRPVYISLLGDYVKNIGFNRDSVARKTGDPNVKKDTQGYQVGLYVGHKQFQKFGDWEVYFFYKRVGADAVLDAFTDSDFHAGGTNAKGWILGASLGLYKNIWVTARWLTADQIIGPPLAIDTLQVDLNVKF
jgi:hypothetical protein